MMATTTSRKNLADKADVNISDSISSGKSVHLMSIEICIFCSWQGSRRGGGGGANNCGHAPVWPLAKYTWPTQPAPTPYTTTKVSLFRRKIKKWSGWEQKKKKQQ